MHDSPYWLRISNPPMKSLKFLFTAAFLSVTALVWGQNGRFGYIDFNNTLKLMPEYVEAQIILQSLQADYREEIDRSKREFERQYIEFMLDQDRLTPSIVAKRQKELQLLMDINAQFSDKVQEELEAKRKELINPIRKRLLKAVSEVCTEKDLDYAIDAATGTYLFINQERGEDITFDVYSRVGIAKPVERVVEGEQPIIETATEQLSESQE